MYGKGIYHLAELKSMFEWNLLTRVILRASQPEHLFGVGMDGCGCGGADPKKPKQAIR